MLCPDHRATAAAQLIVSVHMLASVLFTVVILGLGLATVINEVGDALTYVREPSTYPCLVNSQMQDEA